MKIDKNRCMHCGECGRVCIARAVDHQTGLFDEKQCSLCSHCIAVCPVGAISHKGRMGDTILPVSQTSVRFEDLVKRRRSVRNFKNDPVPIEILERLFALVRYAPTGTNTQAVYMTVIPTHERLQQISNRVMLFFQRSAGAFFNRLTLPLFRLFMGREKADRLYLYKNHYFSRFSAGEDVLTHNAPCLVIFHAPEDSSTPEQDCSIWATTLVLHAETQRLATCYNGFLVYGINFQPRLKKELHISRGHRVYSTVLIGYPDVKYRRSVIREEAKVNIL